MKGRRARFSRFCVDYAALYRFFRRSGEPDIGDETIAAAVDGFDKLRLMGAVTEGLAEHFYIECEIAFFDKPPRPYPLHQFIFFDQTPRILDKGQKRFKDLWRQWNNPTGASQSFVRKVQTEVGKLVDVICLLQHTTLSQISHKNLCKFSRHANTSSSKVGLIEKIIATISQFSFALKRFYAEKFKTNRRQFK